MSYYLKLMENMITCSTCLWKGWEETMQKWIKPSLSFLTAVLPVSQESAPGFFQGPKVQVFRSPCNHWKKKIFQYIYIGAVYRVIYRVIARDKDAMAWGKGVLLTLLFPFAAWRVAQITLKMDGQSGCHYQEEFGSVFLSHN